MKQMEEDFMSKLGVKDIHPEETVEQRMHACGEAVIRYANENNISIKEAAVALNCKSYSKK